MAGGTNIFVQSGSIPSGLSYSQSSERISGTPAQAGEWTATFRAVNAANVATDQVITFTVDPVLPTWTDTDINLAPGQLYSINWRDYVENETSVTYVSGDFPPGIARTSSGFTGRPSGERGSWDIELRATNQDGDTDATFTITVA